MDDSCREILDDLSVYLDGECAGDLEEIVARHLADCPPCLDRADFERELRALVASRCRDAAPPGLMSSVLQRLAE